MKLRRGDTNWNWQDWGKDPEAAFNAAYAAVGSGAATLGDDGMLTKKTTLRQAKGVAKAVPAGTIGNKYVPNTAQWQQAWDAWQAGKIANPDYSLLMAAGTGTGTGSSGTGGGGE